MDFQNATNAYTFRSRRRDGFDDKVIRSGVCRACKADLYCNSVQHYSCSQGRLARTKTVMAHQNWLKTPYFLGGFLEKFIV